MLIIGSLIYLLFSLAVGFLSIGFAWHPEKAFFYLEKHLRLFYQLTFLWPFRLQLGLIGVLFILLCFKFLERIFVDPRRERILVLESPQGDISITLPAIEDMLKRVLRGRREISDVKPKVIPTKKTVEILIRCNLVEEINLQEFQRGIQEELSERLKLLLGEDKDITVRIEIGKMISQELKKKKTETLEEPQIPFRNY